MESLKEMMTMKSINSKSKISKTVKYLLPVLIFAIPLMAGGCGEDKVMDDPEEEEVTPGGEEPGKPEPEPEPEPTPEPTPAYAAETVAGRVEITTVGDAPIASKEEYVGCTVTVTHDNADWNLKEVTGGIRGRGNSTWEWYPKKPYRIKFGKKQSLLGLDAAKSWVLLAEYRDPTDLMNAFVFELGQLAEMPFTNHNRYVEVTLNGDYIGLYHLTEQVQQGSARVNIDEKNGYLIQLDLDDGPELAPGAGDNFWSKVYRLPVCVKNPDEPSSAVLDAVKEDLGHLESAIQQGDWTLVNTLLDVRTMIDFLIIQELVYNVELDAPRSMYMHKDVDGKWTMGPLWDFDAGFDFDWGSMYTGHKYFADYRELVMGTDPKSHQGTIYSIPAFFSDLFKMADFVDAYKARWSQVADMVSPAWERTYAYYQANEEAFGREAERWPIGLDTAVQISNMWKWLKNRKNHLNTVVSRY